MTSLVPEPSQPSTPDAANRLEPGGVAWQRVSPRLRTSWLLTTGITLAIVALAVAVIAILTKATWVWWFMAVPLALGLWAAIIIPRQVRAIGYAERDDDLLIRKGVMFTSIVVVPYGRMQYVDVTAGPLNRALGIASLQLHTAAATTNATIDGLEPAEAERLRDRLASRGEARLAGL